MRDIEPASPAPPGRSSSDAGFSQSLERGLAILSAFKPGRPLLGSSELAREIGLNRSTAHRYVASLADARLPAAGSARRASTGSGRACSTSGSRPSTRWRSARSRRPHLQQLSDETGHTVNMAILDGVDIVYVERCRSSRQGQRDIDLNLHVGSRLPAYCTSMGKVLLAFLPDEERTAAARPASSSSPRGPNTLTARRALLAELARVREAGLADQQRGAGLRPALDRRAGALAAAARWRRRSTSPRTARWSRWRISSRASARPSSAPPSTSPSASATAPGASPVSRARRAAAREPRRGGLRRRAATAAPSRRPRS